jgi:hypothetical protein
VHLEVGDRAPEDVGIESVDSEEDEIDTGLVLDEAYSEPDEEGGTLYENESSILSIGK